MNKVLLAGRLTRDPEMRALASGKHVTQFSVATTEYAGNGKERPEYHNLVVWDRLAEVCGRYLGKGQQVAIEGRVLSSRIETRPRDAPSVNWRPTPSSSASSAAYPRDGRAEWERAARFACGRR